MKTRENPHDSLAFFLRENQRKPESPMKDRSDNRERDRGGSLAWLTFGACLLILACVVPESRRLLVVVILVTAAFRFGVLSSRGGKGTPHMGEEDT